MQFRAVSPRDWPKAAYVKWFSRLTPSRRGGESKPLEIAMRELDGRALYIRAGTTDLMMAGFDYALGVHLPAPGVRERDLRTIVELGSNAGATLASLAERYPMATILGVEPDPRNAEVAAMNVARHGDRVRVANMAVWDEDVTLTIDGEQSTGLMVRPLAPSDPDDAVRIPALSLDSIVSRYEIPYPIDFLSLTVEGTERRMLDAGGEWVANTRAIRIEVQPQLGYRAADCIAQLESLGFDAEFDEYTGRWVDGTRREA